MVQFNHAWLVGKSQFRSLTGVTPEVFDEMARRVRPAWDKAQGRKVLAGRPYEVGGLEDHLVIMLILYRCHITQTFLGLLYGVDKATISRALGRIEKLASRVLGVKRRIVVSAEEAEALIVDCTEQAVHRPRRKQRCWYSGKKKRHTIKTEIVVTGKGRIVGVSKPMPGRVHDLEIRRRGPPLPKNARLYGDSAYQGIHKDHPDSEIPYKKSKNKPLTKDEKTYNHALSRFRVRVEHVIARLKSFRMLGDRYRYPRKRYARKFSIIAGIVNLNCGF